ncbi:glutathione S-transferase [Hoeflea poritis]|uniref:Glutathione S-transferase n=1 Tax=Hoeflea poritis TaxID=2993659 RepID=A0ABT4VJQ6_9HYPH|nr:glutathione S-transferase [Hoeflea poritis]MDA4844953.1 glutathione S-transferase [Hoeflea poritis]
MPDYSLYYWPIAFRGQFVRAVLAHVGASWDEADFNTIAALKNKAPADQPIPFVGPPVLVDHGAGVSLSQMPAILGYLGRKHGLIAGDPLNQAMTDKIVADANDVLYEMTLYNGAQMWTHEMWAQFQPRLRRWMTIFEETARRNGMTAQSGYLLGTESPGIADLTACILWGTMTDKLPPLRPVLDETAPAIAGLSDRIAALPQQARLRERSDAEYGNAWCSGQIEASLRKVLNA